MLTFPSFAGSDTTAIGLRGALYHLCKNRKCYDKVMAEIDAADAAGELSTPIKYAEAVKMPYLIAACKEALRLHPGVGLTVPRHVPKGGATIAGRYFSEGVCFHVKLAMIVTKHTVRIVLV